MRFKPINHPTNPSSTTKGRTMFRHFTAPLLALGIATSAVAGTASALAASHPAATVKATDRSQAGLIRTISGFGYALIGGPDAKINSYATTTLLAKAPSGHLINLLGPAQNPPASFTFRVTAYTGYTGAATMELKRGSYALIERTGWTYTGGTWKLSSLQYAGTTATREALMTANYAFMHDLQQGRNVNAYATPDFLRHAPGGQLINFYGFQNPFRSSSVSVNWLSGGTAQVTQRFDFGAQTVLVRIVTWSYTDSGWKITGVAGPGRG
jgi:hypothetical protein